MAESSPDPEVAIPSEAGDLESAAAPDESPGDVPNEDPADQQRERDSYLAAVRHRVESFKEYPSAARRRKIEGTVVAEFRIAADGSVSRFDVPAGGPRVLTRATERAIRRAAPFPPPPGEEFVVRLPLDYWVR